MLHDGIFNLLECMLRCFPPKGCVVLLPLPTFGYYITLCNRAGLRSVPVQTSDSRLTPWMRRCGTMFQTINLPYSCLPTLSTRLAWGRTTSKWRSSRPFSESIPLSCRFAAEAEAQRASWTTSSAFVVGAAKHISCAALSKACAALKWRLIANPSVWKQELM